MTTLAFAPFGVWPLVIVLLWPLLASGLHSRPRDAAGHAFWFGAGLFLCGTYWLYTSIHVFGQAPLWLAIVLMVGLVVIMAAYFAAAGWLTSSLARGKPWRLLVAAPAAWLAVEWFRGWFLSGFPWLSFGYSQIDSPLAGWLPLLGVYGVSLLLLLTTSAFVVAFDRRGRGRWMAAGIGVLPWLVGAGLQEIEWTQAVDEPLTATIVQGGVSQDRKWLTEQFGHTLSLYRSALLEHHDSRLVVWPEVAIPAVMDQVEDYLQQLQEDLETRDQTLVLGILERDAGDIYNSVLMLGGNEQPVYRKRHLVPFGEYFPVPDSIRDWMRLMSLPYTDMTPGQPRQSPLEAGPNLKLAVAICYEDAYGAEQLYALPEATLLVNVSNDAWFGNSIAPHQHLQIARVRAAEAGRYVVRATNNGVSAFIGPAGELLQTAPQFQPASLTMRVLPMGGNTPYALLGNWPVVSLALAVLAWLGGLALLDRRRPGRRAAVADAQKGV